ncbi:hypothetical protein Tco_1579438 [Tanacetum coccineum]
MEQISVSFLNEECSTIVQNKLPPKLGDLRSFLIPCTVAGLVEYLVLDDLGASINLMPYSLYAGLVEYLALADLGANINLMPYSMNYREHARSSWEIPMRHSYSNDDTCFQVDVIDEVMEEEIDALLDDSTPFSNTPEKISESSLDHKLEEFIAIKIEEIPEQEEEVEDNFE